MKKGGDVPLERALGVFDMFVLGTGSGDFDDVRDVLARGPIILDVIDRWSRYRHILMILFPHCQSNTQVSGTLAVVTKL